MKRKINKNSAESNLEIVNKFLKDNNLESEDILWLEVFGQISDGELEDLSKYDLECNYEKCISELCSKFNIKEFYNDEEHKEVQSKWDEVRDSLDFDLELGFNEATKSLNSGFIYSILPEDIKGGVLRIINNNIHIYKEDDDYNDKNSNKNIVKRKYVINLNSMFNIEDIIAKNDYEIEIKFLKDTSSDKRNELKNNINFYFKNPVFSTMFDKNNNIILKIEDKSVIFDKNYVIKNIKERFLRDL